VMGWEGYFLICVFLYICNLNGIGQLKKLWKYFDLVFWKRW